MKKALLVSFVCLPLAGCFQTTADEPPMPVDAFSIWKQVTNLTREFCSFAPDFQTIANLLALGPEIQIPSALAQGVCKAITGAKAVPVRGKPGMTVIPAPTFRGVRITGHRV